MPIPQELLDAVQKYCDAHTAEHAKQCPTFAGTTMERKWTYTVHQVYIKVVKGEGIYQSVHCFIQITNDEKSRNKWRSGDIFKPKGWAGPIKNKRRGNVLTAQYNVSIYGL